MKFLADENISKSVVLWLREKGHDVLWINLLWVSHNELEDKKIIQIKTYYE